MNRSLNCILFVVLSSSISLVQAQKKDSATIQEQNIEEVVITGYKKQDRKTLTSSIATIDPKVLESVPRSNIGTAFQGALAGVTVNQITGQPGKTPSITIRGGIDFGTYGDDSKGRAKDFKDGPLTLIDGVPGSLFAINAADVESIQVLKDAAASAIYGAQSAAGVIIVTTKQGKKGKTSLNFSSKMTFNFLPKDMEYMNAGEFVRFNRLGVQAYRDQMGNPNALEALLSGNGPAGTGNNATDSFYTTMVLDDSNAYLLNQPGWQTIDDPLMPGQKLIFMNNDYSKLFYQTAMSQDYNLSVSGGTDRSTFYASLGYLDDVGMVLGSSFKRISGTINASFKIKNNLKITSNTKYIFSEYSPENTGLGGNIFLTAAGISPTARIYNNNPDGSLSATLNPGRSRTLGNPLYYSDKFINRNSDQRFSQALQLDWDFARHFSLTTRGSFRANTDVVETFAKEYLDAGNLNKDRKSSYHSSSVLTPQMTTFVSYKNNFNKHHLDALVGHEYKYNYGSSVGANAKDAPTDLITTLNGSADGPPRTRHSIYALNSFFSQITYNFDNRYLFGFNGRLDGSSKLWEDNRYGFFPGVSAGWNIHHEDFFSSVRHIISKAKPRVSYGESGNIESLGENKAFGDYGQTSQYNSQTGFTLSNLPNRKLIWERVKTWNYALDLGFFRNRFHLTTEYYNKLVVDKIDITNLEKSWGTGLRMETNESSIRVKGLEFSIDANLINSANLRWNLSANYTKFNTYVVKLLDNGLPNNRNSKSRAIMNYNTGQIEYIGGREEGHELGAYIVGAYIFDGVYKTQEEIDNDPITYVSFSGRPTQRNIGDAKWKDLNGDGIIDWMDRKIIGTMLPKFTGGISTDLRYKNFSLVIRTDFQIGHLKLNLRRLAAFQNKGEANGSKDIVNTWTADNPNSNLPRYTYADPKRNFSAEGNVEDMTSFSSMFWEKADYLALREVTIGYNMNGTFLNNTFDNMRIFVTGANLHYFTKYTGSNPVHEGGAAADTGGFPIARTFTFGLELSF